MVIEMETLESCRQDIYENGKIVFITHTISASNMEKFVRKIVSDSEQSVDWHSYAGRSVMKYLGDFIKVRKAIRQNKSMHDLFIVEALDKLGFKDKDYCNRICDGIWVYNEREHLV